LHWVPGTSALPSLVLGHVGYSVVPWKRGRGYATHALKAVLPAAKREGLQFVEVTTDVDNVVSQKVVLAAGGQLVERFKKPDVYGGAESFRYRFLALSLRIVETHG
jgi:predicted acetyltransferase